MAGHNSKIRFRTAGRWCARAAAAGLVASIAASSGCTASVPERAAAVGFGQGDVAQGGSWETVFAAPDVQQRLVRDEPHLAAEYGRADGRLGRVEPGPLLATSQWPGEARADLNQLRSVTVRDSTGRVTYFDRDRRAYRGGWWRSDGLDHGAEWRGR